MKGTGSFTWVRISTGVGWSGRTATVSYTHLDVYKRQLLIDEMIGVIRKRTMERENIARGKQTLLAHLLDQMCIRDSLQTGKYNPQPSKQTIANAMDVGDPSNFARIYDLYKGCLLYTSIRSESYLHFPFSCFVYRVCRHYKHRLHLHRNSSCSPHLPSESW